jgi:hypothetical protein
MRWPIRGLSYADGGSEKWVPPPPPSLACRFGKPLSGLGLGGEVPPSMWQNLP